MLSHDAGLLTRFSQPPTSLDWESASKTALLVTSSHEMSLTDSCASLLNNELEG